MARRERSLCQPAVAIRAESAELLVDRVSDAAPVRAADSLARAPEPPRKALAAARIQTPAMAFRSIRAKAAVALERTVSLRFQVRPSPGEARVVWLPFPASARADPIPARCREVLALAKGIEDLAPA